MKTFKELSTEEQNKAVEFCTNELVATITQDDIIPDCMDDYASEIEAVLEEADRLETPWFAHEMLMELLLSNKELHKTVTTKARTIAEIAYFPEASDTMIRIF